jgi:hypothetical protein
MPARHSFTPLALAGKLVQASIGSLVSKAPVGGNVSLKTILGWAAVAFIVWWVIEQPDSAAHLVHNIGSFLSTAASGISHFVSSI